MGERAMRPFWIHQAAEYLIGIAVVATAIQDPEPVVPSVGLIAVTGTGGSAAVSCTYW